MMAFNGIYTLWRLSERVQYAAQLCVIGSLDSSVPSRNSWPPAYLCH
jgi:hypothetical protein